MGIKNDQEEAQNPRRLSDNETDRWTDTHTHFPNQIFKVKMAKKKWVR